MKTKKEQRDSTDAATAGANEDLKLGSKVSRVFKRVEVALPKDQSLTEKQASAVKKVLMAIQESSARIQEYAAEYDLETKQLILCMRVVKGDILEDRTAESLRHSAGFQLHVDLKGVARTYCASYCCVSIKSRDAAKRVAALCANL